MLRSHEEGVLSSLPSKLEFRLLNEQLLLLKVRYSKEFILVFCGHASVCCAWQARSMHLGVTCVGS